MKIGIFGGSFNPIHNQHVGMMEHVLEKGFVDKIWIIPCKNHAFDKSLVRGKQRIEMINLAIRGISNVEVCDIELKSEGINYTFDTITKLKEKYNHEFYLIVGTDILHEIKKWYRYNELLDLVKFVVVKRPNYPVINIPGLKIHGKIIEPIILSSTLVREKVKKGESLKKLVSLEVEQYIKENRLYR